jgi:hypothetical protein
MRITIECPFGILVRKWLILSKILNCDLARAKDIIDVCAIPHNDRHIRGYSERTCPPLPPEDGRFDPTSCTSFDAS